MSGLKGLVESLCPIECRIQIEVLKEAGLQTDFPRVRRLRFQVVDRIDHLALPLLRRIIPLVLRIGNVAEERNTEQRRTSRVLSGSQWPVAA